MKLLKKELNDKILDNIKEIISIRVPYSSAVVCQIKKKIGWWDTDDNSFRLKTYNPKVNIRNNLDFTGY